MIRNIIFDLGGVFVNLDALRTSKAFHALGMKNFEEQYTQARQSGLFNDFDTGKISAQQFRDALKKFLPSHVTDRQIDDAWNAMLLDIPVERLQLVARLEKKYRLFLLSNTNEIHIAALTAYLEREFGFSDFSDYFERVYYSYRIGMRKPDPEIFEFVLSGNKLVAGETLFIDDSVQHVEGAKKTGITGLHLQLPQTILDLEASGVF